MFKTRVAIFCLVMMIVVMGSIELQAQDYSELVNTVAILVVDDYMLTPEQAPEGYGFDPDDFGPAEDGSNCAVTVDGQDGPHWGGGASGASLYPIHQPHGVLVFSEFEYLLGSIGWNPTPWLADPIVPQWLRDFTIWETNGTNTRLILVGVDTRGYETSLISDRIELAIDLLSGNQDESDPTEQAEAELSQTILEGVNEGNPIYRFVVNMSFGLIPCDDIIETEREQYEDIVGSTNPIDPAECALDLIEEDDLLKMRCYLEGYYTLGDLDPNETSFSVIVRGMRYGDFPWRYPLYRHLAGVFEATYSEELGGPTDCPDYLGDDPLAGLFSQYVPSCMGTSPQPTSNGEPIYVIPVASAGNDGKAFPYAPAYWPTVLSVSANYDTRLFDPTCAPGTVADIVSDLQGSGFLDYPEIGLLLADVAARIHAPLTNSGEVVDYGVSNRGLLTLLGVNTT